MAAPITIAVGLKDVCGQWKIARLNVFPDAANHYTTTCPVNIHFPDGSMGKLIKVTDNGRYLYQRILVEA